MRSTRFSGIVRRKSNMTSILVLLLFLLLSPRMDAVDEKADEPELKSVLSPSVVTIGDRVAYTVTVTHVSGQTVSFALPDSTELMPFVLIQREVKRPRKGTTVFEAELALFDIGKYPSPTVSVTFRDTESGGKSVRKVVPEDTITVEALADTTMTELLPIKPLRQPYRPWVDYVFFALVLVVIAATILLIRFFTRKAAESSRKPVDYTRAVLRKIRKLEKNLEKGLRPEECYEQLSHLVREYLEEQYGIKAFEQVTSEIGGELAGCSVPRADTLTALLNTADLVKFAESRPNNDDCRTSLSQAKEALKAGAGQR